MSIGPIAAETTLILPPYYLPVQRWAAPVLTPSSITYSVTDWPFLATIDTADYPSNTLFIFEAIMDTTSAANPVYARLFNVTTGTGFAASEISTTAVHLAATGTRVRSDPFAITSGRNTYRAERGGISGSGAVVHLHLARLIVYHT